MVLTSSLMKNLAAIGLRAKTGRAIAVVLGGSPDAPIVLTKTEIKLVDPKIPETAQPYHMVMELPWEESQRKVEKLARAIEQVAKKAMAQLIRQQTTIGKQVCGVGIVGAPERDLGRIGNFHIRAHAAEGVLFRKVLNVAAEAHGLKWRLIPDKDFERLMKSELGAKTSGITRHIGELGRTVPAPWRADEKQAALAAWLMLHK
jgi:hypothetical protein